MRFLVLGAGGHSREVADLVTACGHSIVAFLSDSERGSHRPTGLPIVSSAADVDVEAATIAIGDPRVRAAMYEQLSGRFEFPVLKHESACLSPHAEVGLGTQVMQNVVVSSTARVGQNVILNVGCFVAHDCVVGSHTHVAPGARLSGGSRVGERCVIGAGAILLPGIRVESDSTVGAGAVVTHDVVSGETVAGVPARTVAGEGR